MAQLSAGDQRWQQDEGYGGNQQQQFQSEETPGQHVSTQYADPNAHMEQLQAGKGGEGAPQPYGGEGGDLGREAPSSQVGYGGGPGFGSEERRFPEDRAEEPARQGYEAEPSSEATRGTGQREYGTVNPNTDSGPGGGYPEGWKGQNQVGAEGLPTQGQQYGLPRPTRPEGAVLLREDEQQGPKYGNSNPVGNQQSDTSTGVPSQGVQYGKGREDESASSVESEVRGGVPHGVTSSGVASGAGIGDQEEKIQQHQYKQTGAPQTGENPPYSQKYIDPGTQESRNQSAMNEEEARLGNTVGGTAVNHHQHEKGGLMTKLKDMMPGHKHHEEKTTGVRTEHAATTEVGEESKPGFMTKVKDKILPSHRHKDEHAGPVE